MGVRTGKPRGRPKGSLNKKSVAFAMKLGEKSAKIARILRTKVFQGDSHDLLMLTYKDVTLDLATRLEAAKAAIPYEKPRLSTVQMSGGLQISHEEALKLLK